MGYRQGSSRCRITIRLSHAQSCLASACGRLSPAQTEVYPPHRLPQSSFPPDWLRKIGKRVGVADVLQLHSVFDQGTQCKPSILLHYTVELRFLGSSKFTNEKRGRELLDV
jgi:hypothetical protein